MNTPILFLLGAFALASLATLVVWIASRPRKVRFGQSIETFNRDLDALAPPGTRSNHAGTPVRRASRTPGPRVPSTPGNRPGPTKRHHPAPNRPNAASSDGR